jgi:hypothetical protein
MDLFAETNTIKPDPPWKVKPELSGNPGELPREPVSKTYKLDPPPVAPDINVGTKITIQTIAYTVLVLVELALTGLAMWSIGHSLPVQIGMVIIGTAATLLGIYLFLRGDVLGVVAWGIYAMLFVLLNWGWTVGNVIQETEATADRESSLSMDREEYKNNQVQIQMLTEKASKTPSWATESAESVERQIIAIQARQKEIRAILERPAEVKASGTFDTVGELVGLDGVTVARWWYLGLFVLIEFFMVLVAPRLDRKSS